jgi:hypothetical protein
MANLMRTLGALPVVFLLVGCPADGTKKTPADGNTGDPACGNGLIDGLEACDPALLKTFPCTALTSVGFTGGIATCTSSCTLDLSGCVGDLCGALSWYGDGIDCDACNLAGGTIDQDCTNLCDGDGTCSDYYHTWFGEWTCVSAGLPRDPDCTALCGNGDIDGFEYCDGTNLDGESCESGGYISGTLACTADCIFDTSGCVPAVCGDGDIEGPEDCDGTNLGGMNCEALGFTGGSLSCEAGCSFDTSLCTGGGGSVCGDGVVTGYEVCEAGRTYDCDGLDLGAGIAVCTATCDNIDASACTVSSDLCEYLGAYSDGWCDQCVYYGGTSDADCSGCVGNGVCVDWYDGAAGGWTCQLATGSRDPDCGTCGDGVRSRAEECDGANLGGSTCISWGFEGGMLTCGVDCTPDFSDCLPELF